MHHDAKVSVIIPTLNAGNYLKPLFASLRRQSVQTNQILVVDSCSKDDTINICKAFGVDCIQIEAKRFDHGGTRNLAASRATGDILVFMTQDALFVDGDCLKNLIKPLDDPSIAASYGRQVPKEEANPIERFLRFFNYPSMGRTKGIEDLPELGIKTFFFSDVCSAIKKSVFEEMGGFPDRTIVNEDMFLAAKLIMKGYRIAYQANAVVFHSHHYPLKRQFQRYFDIGVFFRRNKWIRDLADSEKEGMKYFKEILRFLVDKRQLNWIPYVLIDTVTRFLGYRLGLLEHKLPFFIKRCVSFNKAFWEREI